MRYIFYDIYYGLRNLVNYFYVIWNDRNWDYYYIYKLLEKKIALQSKSMDKYCSHEDKDKLVKQMNFAVGCLQRLIKDDYNKKGFDALDAKWGKLKFADVPFMRECPPHPKLNKLEVDERTSQLNSVIGVVKIIVRDENKIRGKEEEYLEEFNRAYTDEEILRSRDRKNLFRLLDNHIGSWWD